VASIFLVVITTLTITADDSEAFLGESSRGAFFASNDSFSLDDYVLLTNDTDYSELNFITEITGIDSNNYELSQFDIDIRSFIQGDARKVDGSRETSIEYTEIYVHYVARLLITNDTDTILDPCFNLEDDFSDLEDYLGVTSYNIGDELILNGSYLISYYYDSNVTYAYVLADRMIETESKITESMVHMLNMDFIYCPGGSNGSVKEFSLIVDLRLTGDATRILSYDTPYTSIQIGDSYISDMTIDATAPSERFDLIFDGKTHKKMFEASAIKCHFEDQQIGTVEEKDMISMVGHPFYDSPLRHIFRDSNLDGQYLENLADMCGFIATTYDSTVDLCSKAVSNYFDGTDQEELPFNLIIGATSLLFIVLVAAILVVRK